MSSFPLSMGVKQLFLPPKPRALLPSPSAIRAPSYYLFSAAQCHCVDPCTDRMSAYRKCYENCSRQLRPAQHDLFMSLLLPLFPHSSTSPDKQSRLPDPRSASPWQMRGKRKRCARALRHKVCLITSLLRKLRVRQDPANTYYSSLPSMKRIKDGNLKDEYFV